jgi:hypothetical protein
VSVCVFRACARWASWISGNQRLRPPGHRLSWPICWN